ncbi:MAG: hypothetical protein ACXVLQ_01025, partial [Bacteriovorax sp.]
MKFFLIFIFLHFANAQTVPNKSSAQRPHVKLGYFHGGRTAMIYRTFAFKGFEQEGISVDLMTKNLGEIAYCPAP